jgi:hypothetical protein
LARCRFFAQAETNWLALVEAGQTPQCFEEQLGRAQWAMVAHLATMRGVAQRDAASRAPVVAHLQPLMVDEDFEVVRGAAELAGLPAALAASWRQFWRDLQVAIDELGR